MDTSYSYFEHSNLFIYSPEKNIKSEARLKAMTRSPDSNLFKALYKKNPIDSFSDQIYKRPLLNNNLQSSTNFQVKPGLLKLDSNTGAGLSSCPHNFSKVYHEPFSTSNSDILHLNRPNINSKIENYEKDLYLTLNDYSQKLIKFESLMDNYPSLEKLSRDIEQIKLEFDERKVQEEALIVDNLRITEATIKTKLLEYIDSKFLRQEEGLTKCSNVHIELTSLIASLNNRMQKIEKRFQIFESNENDKDIEKFKSNISSDLNIILQKIKSLELSSTSITLEKDEINSKFNIIKSEIESIRKSQDLIDERNETFKTQTERNLQRIDMEKADFARNIELKKLEKNIEDLSSRINTQSEYISLRDNKISQDLEQCLRTQRNVDETLQYSLKIEKMQKRIDELVSMSDSLIKDINEHEKEINRLKLANLKGQTNMITSKNEILRKFHKSMSKMSGSKIILLKRLNELKYNNKILRIGIQQELDSAHSIMLNTIQKLKRISEFQFHVHNKKKNNNLKAIVDKFSQTEKDINLDRFLSNSPESFSSAFIKRELPQEIPNNSLNKDSKEGNYKYKANSIYYSPMQLRKGNDNSISESINSKKYNKSNYIQNDNNFNFKKCHSANQNKIGHLLNNLNYNYNLPNINITNQRETFGVVLNPSNQYDQDILILEKKNNEQNNSLLKLNSKYLTNPFLNESCKHIQDKNYNSGEYKIERNIETEIPFNKNSYTNHLIQEKNNEKNLSKSNQINFERKGISSSSNEGSNFDIQGKKLHYNYLELMKERKNLSKNNALQINSTKQLNFGFDLASNLLNKVNNEIVTKKKYHILKSNFQNNQITDLENEIQIYNKSSLESNLSENIIPSKQRIPRTIEQCLTISLYFHPSKVENRNQSHFYNLEDIHFPDKEFLRKKYKNFFSKVDSCPLLNILFLKNSQNIYFDSIFNQLNIYPKIENEIAFESQIQRRNSPLNLNSEFFKNKFQNIYNISIVHEIKSNNMQGKNIIQSRMKPNFNLTVEASQNISFKLIKANRNQNQSIEPNPFNDLDVLEANPIANEEEVKFSIFNQANDRGLTLTSSNLRLIREETLFHILKRNNPSEGNKDSLKKNANVQNQKSRRENFEYLNGSISNYLENLSYQKKPLNRYWSIPRYLRENPLKVQHDKMLITVKKPILNLGSSHFKEIINMEPKAELTNSTKEVNNAQLFSNFVEFCKKNLCCSQCCYYKGEEFHKDELTKYQLTTQDKYLNSSSTLDQKNVKEEIKNQDLERRLSSKTKPQEDKAKIYEDFPNPNQQTPVEENQIISRNIPRKKRNVKVSQVLIEEDQKGNNLLNFKNYNEKQISNIDSNPPINMKNELMILKNVAKINKNQDKNNAKKEIISPNKMDGNSNISKNIDLSMEPSSINYKSFSQEKEIEDNNDLVRDDNPFKDYTKGIVSSFPIPPHIEIKQFSINKENEKNEENL